MMILSEFSKDLFIITRYYITYLLGDLFQFLIHLENVEINDFMYYFFYYIKKLFRSHHLTMQFVLKLLYVHKSVFKKN